jgi:hypothetical protein
VKPWHYIGAAVLVLAIGFFLGWIARPSDVVTVPVPTADTSAYASIRAEERAKISEQEWMEARRELQEFLSSRPSTKDIHDHAKGTTDTAGAAVLWGILLRAE